MQVYDQILSKKDARKVSCENMLKSLPEFLTKDSKFGKCDEKSVNYMDLRSNSFKKNEDNTSQIGVNLLRSMPRGQHKGVQVMTTSRIPRCV